MSYMSTSFFFDQVNQKVHGAFENVFKLDFIRFTHATTRGSVRPYAAYITDLTPMASLIFRRNGTLYSLAFSAPDRNTLST